MVQHGIHRRITGFGPGNLIEKWLNAYGEGDVNRLEELEQWRTGPYGWIQSAPLAGPYLTHIKMLSSKWPHLQLLADFMEVGTTPVRWNSNVPGGYPVDNKPREVERNERMKRTRVVVLDYPEDGTEPQKVEFKTPVELRDGIAQLDDPPPDSPPVKLRLFVVEDLSREVIETLGARYDVDPAFFREHLVDYVWYNIKDWWRDPPNLDIVSRHQNWFQMRFSRARYFHDKESYAEGEVQARKFNVYRLLQSDFNHSRFWDTDKSRPGKPKEARVGNLRSRATFWIKEPDRKPASSKGERHTGGGGGDDEDDDDDDASRRQNGDREKKRSKAHEPAVGILLLDPTIKEGHPLWRQYRNWNRVPSLNEKIPPDAAPSRQEASFFNDFIYWASRPESFNFGSKSRGGGGGGGAEGEGKADPSSPSPSPICIPTQALLHLVCAEWLTLVDYIKTRLNQVDWEIAFPGNFLAKDEQIEKALGKLHYWRRVVPVYRAMLAETFLRVFRETKHPDRMHPGAAGMLMAGPGFGVEGSTLTEAWRSSMVGGVGGGGGGGLGLAGGAYYGNNSHHHHHHEGGGIGRPHDAAGPRRSALEDLLDHECISAYRQDYTLVLNYLEEYQARIDRLTEVVTAVISIQDSRRGYKDNKNLQWLTWLATFFIPLSFVATMLSMTTGPLDQLHDAAVMWAEVSIPSGLLIMSLVMLMSIARCRRAIRAFFIEFPWVGKARPFGQRKG